MIKNICIYHGNCADGFGAALAVHAYSETKKETEEWEFFAAHYGGEIPDVTDKFVYLVDFCYKAVELKKLAQKAKAILILDHHKTAQAELESISDITYKQLEGETNQVAWAKTKEKGGIYTVFDMNRSGAMIAWEFFWAKESIPKLINHIQDRDLWKFELPGTREISAALFSYDYNFEVWYHLIKLDLKILIDEGRTLERKHFKDMHELVKGTIRKMIIGGHQIWVANLPYTLSSDACQYMCKIPINDSNKESPLPPFTACYMDTPTGRTFSLRSLEGGMDVSEIAKSYGGGGHKHAAGFKIPLPEAFGIELLSKGIA